MANTDDARVLMCARARKDIAANTLKFTYGEVRPVPLKAYQQGKPIVTDCTGWIDCLGYVTPGIGNPFGGAWTGLGNTETMLTYLTHITKAQALIGDYAVWGGPIEHQHGVVLLQPGTVADPEVGSFGSQGGPRLETISAENAAHPGQPLTYLRAVVHQPFYVWQVKTGKGQLLTTTKHPVAWLVAHPKSVRKYGIVSFHREERST
jgi:hypothetical protein